MRQHNQNNETGRKTSMGRSYKSSWSLQPGIGTESRQTCCRAFKAFVRVLQISDTRERKPREDSPVTRNFRSGSLLRQTSTTYRASLNDAAGNGCRRRVTPEAKSSGGTILFSFCLVVYRPLQAKNIYRMDPPVNPTP